MNKSVLGALFLSAMFSLVIVADFSGQNPSRDNNNLLNLVTENPVPEKPVSREVVFSNPAVARFGSGCSSANVNSSKFSKDTSYADRVSFCEAIQRVANKLNANDWSPDLRQELEKIWDVFLTENVKIRPMKKGVSSRIAAAAETFLPNSRRKGFKATLYLRPQSVRKDAFFMYSMHELRHIYDFYQIWKTRTRLSKAELEKRGFRIMGRIARETPEEEKFSRLPKLWDNGWKNLSQIQIREKMEGRIEKYMGKSKFYRAAIREPSKHFIGYKNSSRVIVDSSVAGKGKGARLPYLVKTKQTSVEIAQNINTVSFELERPSDPQNSEKLLSAAIKNEKSLYFKMDNFVYDQDLSFKCWKNRKVKESYFRRRQVARTPSGKPLFEDINVQFKSKKKKTVIPSCVRSFAAIGTDTTETFWAAPYLDEMPVKFEYFTELDGLKVARYTVYKPTRAKFDELAAKHPNTVPFRVFFGTIYVSVSDAQIIKFWGSSFPEATTTGQSKNGVLASYNATAVREKLTSGVWVTTNLNTVAVARKKGKMRPFSYAVKYQNYRQATSDVKIFDDKDALAGSNE